MTSVETVLMASGDNGPKLEVDPVTADPFEDLETSNLQDSTGFEMGSSQLPEGTASMRARITSAQGIPLSDDPSVQAERAARVPTVEETSFGTERMGPGTAKEIQSPHPGAAQQEKRKKPRTRQQSQASIDLSGETILDKVVSFVASLLRILIGPKKEPAAPIPPVTQTQTPASQEKAKKPKRKASREHLRVASETEEEDLDADPFDIPSTG